MYYTGLNELVHRLALSVDGCYGSGCVYFRQFNKACGVRRDTGTTYEACL